MASGDFECHCGDRVTRGLNSDRGWAAKALIVSGQQSLVVASCVVIGKLIMPALPVQVKQICSLVSVRSARLIAAAICGIIMHLQRDKPKHEGEPLPRTCIAVDGGVLVRYRFYRELLVQGVRETLGDAVADQACTPLSPNSPCGIIYLFTHCTSSDLQIRRFAAGTLWQPSSLPCLGLSSPCVLEPCNLQVFPDTLHPLLVYCLSGQNRLVAWHISSLLDIHGAVLYICFLHASRLGNEIVCRI